MDTAAEPRKEELNQIADYIKTLKFKKAVMGGIEPESAYQAMRELVSMFTEIYSAETERSASLELRLHELQKTQGSSNARAEARVQAIKEQTAQRVEQIKAETDSLRDQLQKETAAHRAELDALQAENSALTEQLEAAIGENDTLRAQVEELRSHVAEDNFRRETLEDIYLDANRKRKETLDAATAEAEARRQAANAEIAAQLENFSAEMVERRAAFDAEMDGQREQFRAEMAAWHDDFEREQAQLTAEAEAANARQAQLLAEAKANTAAEETSCRTRCDAMISEAQEKAIAMVSDAEEQALGLMSEAETESNRMRLDAQAEADRRTAEADALVASAQNKYKSERAKYDSMIRRLGEMRTEILHNIQKDVNQLQSLAFHLSSSHIAADTENITSIDELNDLQQASEDSARK